MLTFGHACDGYDAAGSRAPVSDSTFHDGRAAAAPSAGNESFCPGIGKSGNPARTSGMAARAGSTRAPAPGVFAGAATCPTLMSASEVFRKITTSFDRAGICYMLTGSFASAYYGAVRATQDIDFVVDATAKQLQALSQLLPSEQFYVDLPSALEALEQQSMFNVVDKTTGWKIDLIMRRSRAYSAEEFGRRRSAQVQGIPLFIASAEDVVISKLEWATLGESQRQLEDVASVLRMRWDSLDHIYLQKWIAGLGLQTAWNEAQRLAGLAELH